MKEDIRIYRKGKNKTIARIDVGEGRIFKGKASCNLKEDKYDFFIGAEIALARLKKKINDWRYRVRCLDNTWEDFTEGKIYNVEVPYITGDSGARYQWPYHFAAESFERIEDEGE